MGKEDKINQIIGLAAGKSFSIIKKRPALKFVPHGNDRDLFRCQQTGEVLTENEIATRYRTAGRMICGVPAISGCHVIETLPSGENETTAILLFPIAQNEIVINN